MAELSADASSEPCRLADARPETIDAMTVATLHSARPGPESVSNSLALAV
ncbi:MAG: hypothetical protein JJU36_00755 [Phycisphaeraceae bacterium]|nr:hypothetical protein [Phycisphaeraceae bacterium]